MNWWIRQCFFFAGWFVECSRAAAFNQWVGCAGAEYVDKGRTLHMWFADQICIIDDWWLWIFIGLDTSLQYTASTVRCLCSEHFLWQFLWQFLQPTVGGFWCHFFAANGDLGVHCQNHHHKKTLDFTCFVPIIQNFWLLDTEWFKICFNFYKLSRFLNRDMPGAITDQNRQELQLPSVDLDTFRVLVNDRSCLGISTIMNVRKAAHQLLVRWFLDRESDVCWQNRIGGFVLPRWTKSFPPNLAQKIHRFSAHLLRRYFLTQAVGQVDSGGMAWVETQVWISYTWYI